MLNYRFQNYKDLNNKLVGVFIFVWSWLAVSLVRGCLLLVWGMKRLRVELEAM